MKKFNCGHPQRRKEEKSEFRNFSPTLKNHAAEYYQYNQEYNKVVAKEEVKKEVAELIKFNLAGGVRNWFSFSLH